MQFALCHKKGRDCIMLIYDYKKEYSLPIEPSLKAMRIRMSPPVQLENENMFIVDTLEESGIFRIMEHVGGTLCMPTDADNIGGCTTNVVSIAEVRVSVLPETKEVKVDRIIFEYGYEELVHILMQRILFFANFYDCKVSILNLNKKHGSYSKRASIVGGR